MKKKLQTINYTNGDKYYGEIKKDKKHGFGTYTWKDGSVYFGNWENDKKHEKIIFESHSPQVLAGTKKMIDLRIIYASRIWTCKKLSTHCLRKMFTNVHK